MSTTPRAAAKQRNEKKTTNSSQQNRPNNSENNRSSGNNSGAANNNPTSPPIAGNPPPASQPPALANTLATPTNFAQDTTRVLNDVAIDIEQETTVAVIEPEVDINPNIDGQGARSDCGRVC